MNSLKLKFLITCSIVFISNSVWSCDFSILGGFEDAICVYTEADVIYGKIIDKTETSADIEIISMLRGSEKRSVIRVFDSPTFYCNGPWLSPADELGEIGDVSIFLAEKMVKFQYSFETRHYSRLNFPSYPTAKKITNNQVTHPQQGVIDLDEYLTILDLSACLDKQGGLIVFPNPTTRSLSFKVDTFTWNKFQIIDTNGKIVLWGKTENELNEIVVEHLPKGVYFLVVISDWRKRHQTMKFIKN